jgi:hypothetical protein
MRFPFAVIGSAVCHPSCNLHRKRRNAIDSVIREPITKGAAKRGASCPRPAVEAQGSPHLQNNMTSPHASRATSSVISLRLRDLSQLFNSLDPSPFIDRDLDGDAEDFIVSWARELPPHHELKLVIDVASVPPAERAVETQNAVRHYFNERAESRRREFRQLMRRGRISLVIGLVFLAVCLTVGNLFEQLGMFAVSGILQESFIIVGWVAMWRPLEIYLYDWWPLRAEWRVLQRLGRMEVELNFPR